MPIELMDQSQKESLSDESSEIKKCCFDCKTTKTPLWRVGPAGPKSLCNACGIRYRKKRSALLVGLNKGPEKKKEKPTTTPTSAAASTTTKNSGDGGGGKDGKLREGLRVKLMALGEEVLLLKRHRSPMKRQRSHRKLGEEERAAILLMSLSCGSVFA